MALVDLSRFSPNISQDNRQRQVFSNEGAEVYQSLARVGQKVADISLEIVQKNRLREHADYQTKTMNALKERDAAHDAAWAVGAKAGEIQDSDGLTYLESKNKFLKTSIDELSQSAPDKGLADNYSNTLEQYRSARTVDSIKQQFKLGVEASDFNWKNFAQRENKAFSELDSGSYNDYYQNQFKPALDNLYAETSLLSASEAEKNAKQAKMGVSKLILDKAANVDFKRTPITQVVDQIMPLSVQFSADNQRLTIDFIKTIAEPEKAMAAMDAYNETSKYGITKALGNLDLNYKSGMSGMTPPEYSNIKDKLSTALQKYNAVEQKKNEAGLNGDVLQMEEIEVEGIIFSDSEAKAVSRGNTDIWDNADANERVDFYQKILDWKAASSSDSKSSIMAEMSAFAKLPRDLGNSEMTFQNFDKATKGPDMVAELYRTNPDKFKGDGFLIADMLYEATMNKLVADTVLSPGKHKSRGWDAVAMHDKAMEKIASYGFPEVNMAVSRGAVGTKFRVKYKEQAENAHRKFTAMAQDNPMRVLFLTGSSKLLKTADDIYKNGKFDEAAISRFNQLARSEVGTLMTGANRTKLDRAITAPLVAVLRNEVDNARANGDANYDLIMNKTIMKLEPDARATILERLMQGDGSDREMARTLIFKSLHGTPENAAMTNAVLAANTEAEIKDVNDLKSSDSAFKTRSEKGIKKVNALFNSYYQNGKAGVNPDSISASGRALLNYVNSEVKSNPSGDPSEIAQAAFTSFFKGKVAVGTKSLRGTIALKEDETLSRAEVASETELNRFKSELFKGKIQLNTEGMPLTDKMIKSGVNFKTQEGFNKFMGYGYKIQFQTLSDDGKGREVIPVFIDENTGVRYRMRDANKKLIRRSIP
jgi:hypothetical protein